jgi:sialate O-acetylesterase
MAEADLPMFRLFRVKHQAAEKPKADCEGEWVVCNPDTVKDFSAVGYFFARELNRGLRAPIGLIESAWGPSPVEAWMPHGTLEKEFQGVLRQYEKAMADYPQALSGYEARLAEWQGADGAAQGANGPLVKPVRPLDPGGAREPAGLYNGMISPLARYPIRGVVWYQGESNTADAALYGKMFPAMIGAWRTAWGEGAFPFLYAQLSGFMVRHPEPEESRWAELREAQAMALSTPKTGMAVTADTGEEHEMHPADKQDVGHRLALLAENEVYGETGVTASGPVFAGMEIRDGKAALGFTHTTGGLVVGNGELKGFAIAGEDRRFVWADARIDGDKVIVQSKETPNPVAVRYGWADFPDCGLWNGAGLPAAPFRTDNWVAGEAAPAASPPKPAKHHAPAA